MQWRILLHPMQYNVIEMQYITIRCNALVNPPPPTASGLLSLSLPASPRWCVTLCSSNHRSNTSTSNMLQLYMYIYNLTIHCHTQQHPHDRPSLSLSLPPLPASPRWCVTLPALLTIAILNTSTSMLHIHNYYGDDHKPT